MEKINRKIRDIKNGSLITCKAYFLKSLLAIISFAVLSSCNTPKEQVVLRQIKDVVVDASSSPKLKAKAIFYNPNDVRMRLKKIDIEIFVDGKKVGDVDQELKLIIPAQDEFTLDLELILAMKEQSFMDTLFGMIGGKKMQVEYKGALKLTYHGLPIRVPVNYKDEIRLKF
jgi:LEA14-like dessication related protein